MHTFVFLEHIGEAYNKYVYDQHGLHMEDIQRTDHHNWAFAQCICHRKVQNYLKQLCWSFDTHCEHTIGTKVYLQVCANYIDIFLSISNYLRAKIVLVSKVSFFFRLWRLWLKCGDHTVGGNPRKLTLIDSFLSNQWCPYAQLLCHFVVLLIMHFIYWYPSVVVPLHLDGSDPCEVFFSKNRGM